MKSFEEILKKIANLSEISNFPAAGIKIAKSSKGTRKAAHALHALLSQAMGQCQKHKPRVEVVGDWKANWTRKNANNLNLNFQVKKT